jgi:amidase
MDELLNGPAITVAEAIRTRQVSAVDVVTATLARIEQVNPGINAVVQLASDALERAQAADAALARGDRVGVLHGVPFTAKDIFDTAGVISAAGIEERAANVPARDATVITRLRDAGAVLVGKTNCSPGGGGGITDNPVYGRTNNPYNIAHTVGGSSGGDAAILGAGGSLLSIGSDSGGSLRLPAHYCGVATLKPTSGRVPNTGAYLLPGGLSDPRSQIGPMSRYVADLKPVLRIIAGPDSHDSGVVPVPLGSAAQVQVAGMRVAWFADDGVTTTTPETRAAVRAAVDALADAGALLEERFPAPLAEAREITEGYWSMEQQSGAEIVALFERWDGFRSAMLGWMAQYDAILCPVDAHPAPPHDEPDPQRFAYTLGFSLAGNPCVVVRAGADTAGLPIGVQIAARVWEDHVAVALATQIETVTGGWQAPDA